MAKKTKSTNKKPMSKGGKIAIISISAALVIGGGVTAFIFSSQIKDFVDKWFHGAKIANVDEEYKTEQGVVKDETKPEETLPYLYLGSAEKSITLEGETNPEPISAHTFLIGRVNSVPFYQSGWTRFDYENIGMTISFSQISSESVANSLSTTNERVESSSWSTSTHFQEKFVASAEAKIGPVKLKAENTIDYQVDKSSSGSSMQRYVSSNEQTNTSIETLQKTADYSVQLNSRNGFKKGKYYRMTLQQTASMYMIIYERSAANPPSTINADEEPVEKFYELTSFLADPNNYTMVVEETDDPAAQPKQTEQFKPELYDRCAEWIEKVRAKDPEAEPKEFDWVITDDKPEPEPRYETLKKTFDGNSFKSDYYYRTAEWRITDAEKWGNPSDKIAFPTLFKSKYAPTFAELFNDDNEDLGEYRGLGFKYVDIELQFDYREYNDGFQHIYLMDKTDKDIKHEKTDINSKWQQKRIVWSDINAIDNLRTSMVPSEADGKIHIRYEGSGKHSDDWGIKNLVLQVTIRK